MPLCVFKSFAANSIDSGPEVGGFEGYWRMELGGINATDCAHLEARNAG